MSAQPCGCDFKVPYYSEECARMGVCRSENTVIPRMTAREMQRKMEAQLHAAVQKKFESEILPTDPKARKTFPIASGVLDYFPDALAAIAHVSYVGNEQHNPGQPLHWAREKSTDQNDTMIRHYLQRGTKDTDGCLHTAKMAWRALAMLQLDIEGSRK